MLAAEPDSFLKELTDLCDTIFIARTVLHVARSALHVHQNHRHLPVSHQPHHLRIKAQGRNVVDDTGAGVNSRRGGSRPICIDRETGINPLVEPFNHGNYATRLLIRLHRRRPGPSGLAADIDNICTFLGHLNSSSHRLIGRIVSSPIGKRIWCDVQNAHHERPGQGQLPSLGERDNSFNLFRFGECSFLRHRSVPILPYRQKKNNRYSLYRCRIRVVAGD